uniref:TPR_REGION domain-containing protein n=1 Tax=Meloidogyne hapla TaxID=6305 RepID=A0A1I8BI10_MELHA
MYSKSQISIFELAERRKALGIGVYNEKQYQEAIRIFNDIVRSLCPKSAESIIRAHSDLLAICENNIAAYYDNLVNKSSQPVLRAVSSDMQKYINEDGRRRVPIEDIARSVWNNRRALPVEKAGTLSVLSDDSFISACDEFVNLCEIPSSDKESISTDFATLALYNNGLKATESGDDFAAKLFGIRLAFRRLMDDPQTMQRLVQYGRIIMADLLRHDKRDPAEFYAVISLTLNSCLQLLVTHPVCQNLINIIFSLSKNFFLKAYDRMIAFINDENNLDTILNELKSRKVESTNLWDTLFDLIILDAFEGQEFIHLQVDEGINIKQFDMVYDKGQETTITSILL